jgi:hypothetical protein
MARYDKSVPGVGTHRAPVAAAWLAADLNKIFGVGLDVNGRLVKGGGQTDILGVLVVDKAKVIGDIVDVMTHGEIVEASLSDGTTAIAAGTKVFADDTTGLLGVAAGVGKKPIGYTVEGGSIPNTRLIVNMDATLTQAV